LAFRKSLLKCSAPCRHKRKDVRLITVKPLSITRVAASYMHSVPMVSTSYKNEKSIGAL